MKSYANTKNESLVILLVKVVVECLLVGAVSAA